MPLSSKSKSPRAKRRPAPQGHPFVRHVVALYAAGWRISTICPGEAARWHVTIIRTDQDASMTATATELDVVLAELVRYTSADAAEKR